MSGTIRFAGSRVSITGNKFHQCRTGVMLEDFDKPDLQGPARVSITGSTFVETRERYIFYYVATAESSGTEKDIIISSNISRSCEGNSMGWDGLDRHAIELSHISGTVITRNIFDGGPFAAIYIRGRTDAHIVGNELKDSELHQ